jgi:glycosyltransferase involved in cell wall biosynthesis
VIVVDDASTDDSLKVAQSMGATALRLPRNAGPSSARNFGAKHATGDILFFVDADVLVAPGAVKRVVHTFEARPEIAAVFGSYDAEPRASGFVSQYRNLLHHQVHQAGQTAASTFWGACGAIRRSVFEALGGFDQQEFPRCIEDIELGYRLRQAGHRILLDKELQGKHLKRWTLRSMIRTDIYCRAMPWTRLVLQTRRTPDDLNLRDGQRLSVSLLALAICAVTIAPFHPTALFVALAALLCIAALNRALYVFFLRHRGWRFAAGAFGLHLLYFFYGGLTYAYVWVDVQLFGGALTFAAAQGRPRMAGRRPTREPASPL